MVAESANSRGSQPCCNPDCDRPGSVFVGLELGDYACASCAIWVEGDDSDPPFLGPIGYIGPDGTAYAIDEEPSS